jgi:hypothetical protein
VVIIAKNSKKKAIVMIAFFVSIRYFNSTIQTASPFLHLMQQYFYVDEPIYNEAVFAIHSAFHTTQSSPG